MTSAARFKEEFLILKPSASETEIYAAWREREREREEREREREREEREREREREGRLLGVLNDVNSSREAKEAAQQLLSSGAGSGGEGAGMHFF